MSTFTPVLARGPGGRVSTTERDDAMSIAMGNWREHRNRRTARLAALHDAELRNDLSHRLKQSCRRGYRSLPKRAV
jgi:hypothetical protein